MHEVENMFPEVKEFTPPLLFSLSILIRLNGLSGITTIITATAGSTVRIDTVIDRILDVLKYLQLILK